MEVDRLRGLLVALEHGNPGLEWRMEPDYDGIGATFYLSLPAGGDVAIETYPGVPSVRAHVAPSSVSFVFEEVAEADVPEFLESVLSGRLFRVPPEGLAGRLLRVKTLRVEGQDKSWVATR